LFENVNIFIFFKFYTFFIFELLENTCHTTRVARQTLKEKENYCWYFFEFLFCEFLWFSNIFDFLENIKKVEKKDKSGKQKYEYNNVEW